MDDDGSRDHNLRLTRPGWIAAIPTAVLLAVFALQFVTAQTTVLAQWKGGGFGMFSSVDTGVNRIVDVYFEVDGEVHPVTPPEAFDGDLQSLVPMPTEERAEEVAQGMLNSHWVEMPETVPPGLEGLQHEVEPATDRHFILRRGVHEEEDVVQLDAVRLKVWKLEFEADDASGDGTLQRRKLEQVDLRREGQ